MRDLPQLRPIREERALSQRDLAGMSGVAQDSISQIERGERKARPSTVRKLAHALSVEPTDLLAKPVTDSASGVLGANYSEHVLREIESRLDSTLAGLREITDESFADHREWLNELKAIDPKEINPAEIKEFAEVASGTYHAIMEDAHETLEAVRHNYGAIPDHYYEDPYTARRIGRLGSATATFSVKTIQIAEKFLGLAEEAHRMLTEEATAEARDERLEAWISGELPPGGDLRKLRKLRKERAEKR
jgi:transcriptional regulator with XRE-family HTH domain